MHCIPFPVSSEADAEAEDMAAALISPAGAWLTKPQVQWSGGGGAASSSLDSDFLGPGNVKFGQRQEHRAGGALVSCGRKGVARAVGGAVDLSPPASAPASAQVQEGLVISHTAVSSESRANIVNFCELKVLECSVDSESLGRESVWNWSGISCIRCEHLCTQVQGGLVILE